MLSNYVHKSCYQITSTNYVLKLRSQIMFSSSQMTICGDLLILVAGGGGKSSADDGAWREDSVEDGRVEERVTLALLVVGHAVHPRPVEGAIGRLEQRHACRPLAVSHLQDHLLNVRLLSTTNTSVGTVIDYNHSQIMF